MVPQRMQGVLGTKCLPLDHVFPLPFTFPLQASEQNLCTLLCTVNSLEQKAQFLGNPNSELGRYFVLPIWLYPVRLFHAGTEHFEEQNR